MLKGLHQHKITRLFLMISLVTDLTVLTRTFLASQSLIHLLQNLPAIRFSTKLIIRIQFLQMFVIEVLVSLILCLSKEHLDILGGDKLLTVVFWAVDYIVSGAYVLFYGGPDALVAERMETFLLAVVGSCLIADGTKDLLY